MKHIIFAGGTGTRFWPASRKKSPKQFQSIIENKPLIRVKFEYLLRGFKAEDIFLSTGIAYKNEAEKIIPELPKENFIFEPDMRDTGPAVALAIAYVNAKHPNEIVSTQWADHFIKDPAIFNLALKSAEKLAKTSDKIVIIGVPPRMASPHRGYIKYGKKIKTVDNAGKIVICEFLRFVEKPTLEVAQQYLKSGDYSWNPGYFVSKPNLIMDKYKTFAPEVYKTIMEIASQGFSDNSLRLFSVLEKISFDYVISENINKDEAIVLKVDMGWSDVGEWISLHETLAESAESVVTKGNVKDMDSNGTLIYNYEPKKLIATIRLKDMIVINTEDVVAIFHKDDNGKIKQFLKELELEGKTDYL